MIRAVKKRLKIDACKVDHDIYQSFIRYFIPKDNRDMLFERIDNESKLLNQLISMTIGYDDILNPNRDMLLDLLKLIENRFYVFKQDLALKKLLGVDRFLYDLMHGKRDNKKAVLFVQHPEVARAYEKKCRFLNPSVYSINKPYEIISNFQKYKDFKLLIVLTTGIFNIDFSFVNHFVYADMGWDIDQLINLGTCPIDRQSTHYFPVLNGNEIDSTLVDLYQNRFIAHLNA